jgi:transposase-like protein
MPQFRTVAPYACHDRRASRTAHRHPRNFIPGTNAIESLNARYRRAIKARGHFPTEQAALKCLYLVTRSLDPTGTGRTRWAMRWKPALNAFAITFGDRFPSAETY